MANKQSCAAQAIKDMLELGMNVSFLTGVINRIHSMNATIGIVTKEKPVKKVKRPKLIKVTEITVNVTVTAKVKVNRNFHINPDGTIALDNDWDFK